MQRRKQEHRRTDKAERSIIISGFYAFGLLGLVHCFWSDNDQKEKADLLECYKEHGSASSRHQTFRHRTNGQTWFEIATGVSLIFLATTITKYVLKLPRTGFELRNSSARSDHSANYGSAFRHC